MKQYIVSVDLGELNDYTAVSILQEVYARTGRPASGSRVLDGESDRGLERVYHLRHLDRPPLRTSYPDIVEKVSMLMRTPPLDGNAELVIDATGVGRPVVEMFRREGIRPTAITITGGHSVTRMDDGGYCVPKRDLVAALQTLIGCGRLKIATSLPLSGIFLEEMENFKFKVSPSGSTLLEAWREHDHDDIVLSVALGAWWAVTMRPTMRIMSRQPPKVEYDILRLGL